MIEQLENECWDLDVNLAYYILPRLLYFKNWTDKYGCPDECEDLYEWNEILEELCWTFSYIISNYKSQAIKYIDDIIIESNQIIVKYSDKDKYDKALEKDTENRHRCQAGLNLFAKYYMNLWI